LKWKESLAKLRVEDVLSCSNGQNDQMDGGNMEPGDDLQTVEGTETAAPSQSAGVAPTKDAVEDAFWEAVDEKWWPFANLPGPIWDTMAMIYQMRTGETCPGQ
jgi:hypothetical protein